MGSFDHPEVKTLCKIEDVIEKQKDDSHINEANGNFAMRQVAFNLLSETHSSGSRSNNQVKSLHSGLSKQKGKSCSHKKIKRNKTKRPKSPIMPDDKSWPSDSDITVLRMKLYLNNSDLKEEVNNVVLGDGLHQPNSSSMVNLATLILQPRSPSKPSINVKEELLAVTSWELPKQEGHDKSLLSQKHSTFSVINETGIQRNMTCSHVSNQNDYSCTDSDYCKSTKTSKMARFLRLYFCPCCTCLYKLEKMQDESSGYFTK